MLEVGAPGGDRLEPAVRHLPAVAEVEVLKVQAPGGDRPEPAVRHAVAVAQVEVLEVGAAATAPRPPCSR